jgi:hypothetical protein
LAGANLLARCRRFGKGNGPAQQPTRVSGFRHERGALTLFGQICQPSNESEPYQSKARSTQAGSITQGTVIYHLVRKLYLEEIAAVETRHDFICGSPYLALAPRLGRCALPHGDEVFRPLCDLSVFHEENGNHMRGACFFGRDEVIQLLKLRKSTREPSKGT